MTQEERTQLYKRLLKILLELEGETEVIQEAQDIIVTLMMDEKSGTPTAPVTPPYVPPDAPPNTPHDFPRKWWQDPWCYFKWVYKKDESPSYTTPSSSQATITAKE